MTNETRRMNTGVVRGGICGRSLVAVGLMVAAAACSDSSSAGANDKPAAVGQSNKLEAALLELDAATAKLAKQDERIASQQTDLASGAGQIEQLESDLEILRIADAESRRRADAAEAEVDKLLATYDVEIRADAQLAWDAAVVEACEQAGLGDLPVNTYVDHRDDLAVIGTRVELVDQVVACAAPLRERSEFERLNAECAVGDPDAVTKDVSAMAGDCLVVFVVPFQWDSRTGTCAFLGSWDGVNLGTRSYKYDADGLFRAREPLCADQLSGADQDDLLKVWVTVLGPYRYDTAAGGTNEVPEFEIVKAELVRKA